MKPIRDPAIIARMRMTFDLFEAAEAMMRQNLRRRHPEASEPEIERLVGAWLQERPGAPYGDVGGPIRTRPFPD